MLNLTSKDFDTLIRLAFKRAVERVADHETDELEDIIKNNIQVISTKTLIEMNNALLTNFDEYKAGNVYKNCAYQKPLLDTIIKELKNR